MPEQLIPYVSKHSIRLEENPDPICGDRVSDQRINKLAWFTEFRENFKNHSLQFYYEYQDFTLIVLYRFVVFIKWTNIILGMTIYSSA